MHLPLFLLAFTAASLLCASAPLPELADYSSTNLRWEIISNGLQQLSNSLGCDACKVGVGIIQALFSQNATGDEIAKAVTKFCNEFKLEDPNVCSLVVQEFKVPLILTRLI